MKMLLLVLLMLLVVFWMWTRRRQAQQSSTHQLPDRRSTKKKTGEYHAVSIKFPANACLAAKELQGRRFLANEAPQLPLPECDVTECKCIFAHHDDRRTGKDRRSPFAAGGMAGSTGRYETERRQGQDRRHPDDDPDPW